MVRHYKRKKLPPPYSKSDLEQALAAIGRGELTVYKASKVYKIPKPTLHNHFKKKRGVKSSTGGRAPVFSNDVEEKMAHCIKTMNKWGFGLSKKEFLEAVGIYVNTNKLITPFKDGIPGDDFYQSFSKRHNLSLQKPQAVEVKRKRAADPFVLEQYFKLVKEVTDGLAPSQIYNVDETSFCADPQRVRVVGEKNSQSHRATSGPGRENTSVLLGGSAAGEKLPPLIIFKGKNIWNSWVASEGGEFPGTSYAASPNGWMESSIFLNWFQKNFITHIGPSRPVVLILDGHKTHLGIDLVSKALEENITILKMPPHTSHLLQPMDLAVFGPLKQIWDQQLIKWQRKNFGKKLPKAAFSKMLSEAWEKSPPENIVSGFRKGGIFPFSDTVIPEDKFLPEVLKKWKAWKAAEAQTNDVSSATAANNNSSCQSSLLVASNHQSLNDCPPSVAAEIPQPADGFSSINPSAQSAGGSNFATPVEILQPGSSFSTLGPSVEIPDRGRTFEEILLEQVKQMPLAKLTRKKVCPGAEVITSKEAIERRIEEANNNKRSGPKKRKTNKSRENDVESTNSSLEEEQLDTTQEPKEQQKKGKSVKSTKQNMKKEEEKKKKEVKKKKTEHEETTDEESISLDTSDSDDFDFEAETREVEEEEDFLQSIQNRHPSTGDWVLVKFPTRKSNKIYIGQVAGVDPCLEVKFARKKGEDGVFCWPSVEDKSIVRQNEILKFLPTPTEDKRGRFRFGMSFDGFKIE